MEYFKDALLDAFANELEDFVSVLDENIYPVAYDKDAEQTEVVFRLFHSLKGSAGMAGYMTLSKFGSTVCELMRKLKNKDFEIPQEKTALFVRILHSSLCLINVFFYNLTHNEDTNEKSIYPEEMQQKAGIITNDVNRILGEEVQIVEAFEEDEKEEDYKEFQLYEIEARFSPDIMEFGTDPKGFLGLLKDYGEFIFIKATTRTVPEIGEYNEYHLFLAWKIIYKTKIHTKDILKLFRFKEDNIKIIHINDIVRKLLGDEAYQEENIPKLINQYLKKHEAVSIVDAIV